MMQLNDQRVLRDVKAVKDALSVICSLHAVEYLDKANFGAITPRTTIPAQDMLAIPGATECDGIGYMRSDAVALIPHLVAAVQELAEKVISLETLFTQPIITVLESEGVEEEPAAEETPKPRRTRRVTKAE